jgi:small-conductance mechanosensitive channel
MEAIFEKLLTIDFLILIIAVILLTTFTGFVIRRRRKLNREIKAPKIMRYLVIPTTFFYLLFTSILGLSHEIVFIKILETLLIIFFITFLLNMISHLFFSDDNIITQKEVIPKLGRDIIYSLLVVLASIIVFSRVWGFDIGNLLTALGVGSFVIGLALQEPLGNLFNGVALLMAKPFQNGDWIQIGTETGKVVEFNWSSIKLVNRFNELIIIPNNKFAKEQIRNLSRPSKIHAEMVKVGFSYNDDPIKVKKVLLDIANKTDGVLKEPKSTPVTIDYGDFYIKYGLKFYIRDYEDVIILKDRIMTQIYHEAKIHSLTIPFPIRDIIIREDKINDVIN